MTRRLMALLAVAALGLAACGDDDTDVAVDDPTTTTTEPAADPDDDGTDAGDGVVDPDADRPDYTGGYTVDYDTGEVDVSAYADFLAEHGAPAAGLEAAGRELIEPSHQESLSMGADLEVSSAPADGGRTVVTVVVDGLPDDSIAAERFELVFVGDGDDVLIESGSWAQRCWPGRGHQDWDVELCL
jgi:hypothetical protein